MRYVRAALGTSATAIETIIGGSIAGWIGKACASLSDNPVAAFFGRHLPSAAGGSTGFTLSAVAIRYYLMYCKERDEGYPEKGIPPNPNLTFEEFAKNHRAEIIKFTLTLEAAGFVGFALFTSSLELLKDWNPLFRGGISSAAGFGVIAIANFSLQFPAEKLAQILAVFFGFSVGTELLGEIIAKNWMSPELINNFAKTEVPALSGASAALFTGVSIKTHGAIDEKCKKKERPRGAGYDRLLDGNVSEDGNWDSEDAIDNLDLENGGGVDRPSGYTTAEELESQQSSGLASLNS